MRSRLPWQLGLATLVIALLTTRGVTTGDDAVHLDLAIAIATRGETTLSIDPGELWVPSRPIAGGLFYQADDGLRSAHPPGLAWIAVPLVAIGSALASGPPPSFDPLFRESSAPIHAVLAPIARDPRTIAFTLIGPISAALAVVFLALAALELGASRRAIVAGSCAFAIGSPLLAYAGTCWTQLPTTALLAFVLWRITAREVRASASAWPIGIGVVLVMLVRTDHLVFAIPTGAALYAIERRWRRSPSRAMARFVVPIAIASFVLAWWEIPQPGGGWSLARLPIGALGLLFSPRTGLVVYAPLTIFAALGLAKLRERAPPLAMMIGAWLALALVVYGGWFDWPASLAYGPRFLVPMLPGLALALIALYDAIPKTRAPIWITAAIGLGLAIPGALVAHVRIDELDRFAHPTFFSAWRALGDGIDCLSGFLPIYAVLALLAALAGAAISRGRRPRAET